MTSNQDSNSAASEMAEQRARLQEMAEAADRGEAPSPLDISPSAQQGDEATEINKDKGDRASESDKADEKPDSPESSADKQDKSKAESKESKEKESLGRDNSGRFKKADDKKEDKPETNYSRAKKDEARLARNRQEFEQEKAEFRQKASDYERRMADMERRTQPAQQQQQGPRFNSQQLHSAAQEFEKRAAKLFRDGDADAAEEQLGLADKARTSSQEEARKEHAERVQQFEAKWQEHCDKAIGEHPELGDPNSEAAQAMSQLLREYPILGHVEDGFKTGVQILLLRRDSAEASGLRDENNKLKTRVTELEKLTTPEDGKSSVKHSASTSFESMTNDQQRDHLRRQAELADEQAA